MQHRSGNNRLEPLYNDKRSRAWVFIIRIASEVTLPEAFVPYANYVSWAAYPGPSLWTLRGYCQWTNPRNYHTLKTRYCKVAEWIPVDVTDKRIFDEHTSRPLNMNSYRFTHGIPFGVYPPKKTLSLTKVGLGIEVSDLTEEYSDYLASLRVDNQEVFDPARVTDDGLVTDDGIYWYNPQELEYHEQRKRDRESEKYYEFDLGGPPLKKSQLTHQFFLGEK